MRSPLRAAKTVLPVGIADVLPPHAAFEATIVERLMDVFETFGYERVKPPLVEFEAGLLSGAAAALAPQSFRIMDPVSQNMLALRPDMTMQVARIAADRLGSHARPLRLAYAGQVVRVRGSQLRPARQFGQVGAELIGSDAVAADAEAVVMASEALKAVGIGDVTVDFGMPTLVPAVLSECGASPDAEARLFAALERKDPSAVEALSSDIGRARAALLAEMVSVAGPADAAMAALMTHRVPTAAAAERAVLAKVIDRVRRDAPSLTFSVDPVERRGFEYHTGVTFAVFVPGLEGEVGRGGRYRAESSGTGEPATGFTLFLDMVLSLLRPPPPRSRVFVPFGTDPQDTRRLRAEGWAALAALDPAPDPRSEAVRLNCSHLLADGQIIALSTTGKTHSGD